jgi:hypothetical protein
VLGVPAPWPLSSPPVNVAKTRIMLSAAGDDAGADAMRKVEKARGKRHSMSSLASENGVTRKSGLM